MVKSKDLVLSSPKWILDLLTINQSQLCSHNVIIMQYLSRDVSLLLRKILHGTACDILMYMEKRRGPGTDLFSKPLETNAGSESLFCKSTKKVPFVT